jgi:hypothetical protein
MKWPIVFLLWWFCWQFVSALQTVSPSLTASTLRHFTACMACFFIGWFALAEVKNFTPLWIGILLGFIWMLRVGLDQHFGGLEATRRHFEMYVRPTMQVVSPELIKKMAHEPIFSTLFYANTLRERFYYFFQFRFWRFGN